MSLRVKNMVYAPALTRQFFRCIVKNDRNGLNALLARIEELGGEVGPISEPAKPCNFEFWRGLANVTDGTLLDGEFSWDTDYVFVPEGGPLA